MNRREVLASLGVAASAVAGCLSGDDVDTETPPTEPPTETPTNVAPTPPETDTDSPTGTPTASPTPTTPGLVDVVEAGADPTGEEPIDDVIDPLMSDDAILRFPSGEYRVNRLKANGLDGLEFVAPEGARLLPPDDVGTANWLFLSELSNFRFEGFTIDNTAIGTSPAHIFNVVGGQNVIKDVTVEGYRPNRRHCLMPWAEGAETTLTLDNVRLPDGNDDGAGVYIIERSLYNTDQGPGTLRFHDCHVENFSQGVYASGHGGPIEFVGGRYANNGIAQIRAGGGHAETRISGVTVEVDGPADPVNEKPNMRGIWLREGSNAVIEDSTIRIADYGTSFGDAAILVHFYHGDTTIRNTDIRVSEPTPGIMAYKPTRDIANKSVPSIAEAPDDWGLTIEDTTVTSEADGVPGIEIRHRAGNRLENVCVSTAGADQDGIVLADTTDSVVRNSTIDASGTAVRSDRSEVTTESVSNGGDCAADTPNGTPEKGLSDR